MGVPGIFKITTSTVHRCKICNFLTFFLDAILDFTKSSVILMATILKIGHTGNFVPTDHVLIMIREMSLNKMVPLMERLAGGGGVGVGAL